MDNSAEKEICYEVNDSENIGDCGPEEKFNGLTQFTSNCSEENGSSDTDAGFTNDAMPDLVVAIIQNRIADLVGHTCMLVDQVRI